MTAALIAALIEAIAPHAIDAYVSLHQQNGVPPTPAQVAEAVKNSAAANAALNDAYVKAHQTK